MRRRGAMRGKRMKPKGESPAPKWALPMIGAILSLLLVFGLGFSAGKEQYGSDRAVFPKYRFVADDPSGIQPANPTSRPELERRQPCANPRGHDEADLCAQWRAAVAAEQAAWAGVWSMRFTVAGAIFSALGLLALISTLRQGRRALARARKANRIADRASKNGLRAYLVFHIEVIEISLKGPSPYIVVRFSIINTGQTPAKDIQISRRLKVGKPFEEDGFFILKVWKPTQSRMILGSGQEAPRTKRYGLTIGDARDIQMGKKHIYFYGEAAYQDIFGKTQTLAFRRWMNKSDLSHFSTSPSGETST